MPKKPKDPSTKVEERWVEWSDLENGVNLKAGHPVILFLGGVKSAGTTTTVDPNGPAGQTTKAPADAGTTTTKAPGPSDDSTTTTEAPDSPPTTTSGGEPGNTTSQSPATTTTSSAPPDNQTTSGPPRTTSQSGPGPTTSLPPPTSSSLAPPTTSSHAPTTTTTHAPTTTTTHAPTTTTTHAPTTTTTHAPTTTSTHPPTTTSHPPTTTSKAPQTQFVRFTAEHFDTAKSFPLPAAGKAIKNFQTIAAMVNKDPTIQLLILGHTDTQASDTYNMQLSKERATSIQQYLVNDNNSWYAWYSNADPQKKWGLLEDQWMLNSLPYNADGTPPATPYYNRTPNGVTNADFTAALKKFQAAVKEPATGTVNKSTRLKLILAYMQAEGTSVPAATVIKMQGCSFQNQATGQSDGAGVNNPINRRVEVFAFTGTIAPDPSAWAGDKKGTYAAWLKTLPDGVYDDS